MTAHDIFVNIWPSLELREGRPIFSPSFSIRSLVSPRKSLKLNSLEGGGVFLSHAFFYPEKYSNIREATIFESSWSI